MRDEGRGQRVEGKASGLRPRRVRIGATVAHLRSSLTPRPCPLAPPLTTSYTTACESAPSVPLL